MDSSNSKSSKWNIKQEKNGMKQERREKRMKIQQSAIEKVASSQREDLIQEESSALKTSSTAAVPGRLELRHRWLKFLLLWQSTTWKGGSGKIIRGET